MSILADYREAPRPGFMPNYGRGKIRALVQDALASFRSVPGDSDMPQMPQTRHEAMIAAARIAFGGTINW